MHAYVIKRGPKWCTGHSYATGIGATYSWTTQPFEARLYKDKPTTYPKSARVVLVPVSPFIFAALHNQKDPTDDPR